MLATRAKPTRATAPAAAPPASAPPPAPAPGGLTVIKHARYLMRCHDGHLRARHGRSEQSHAFTIWPCREHRVLRSGRDLHFVKTLTP